MLTGFLEPSAGTAIVEGYDIMADMGQVYCMMGVCPQHDLLWEQLTGEEHLLFYGRLKGLRGADLTRAVEAGLRGVNLWHGGVGRKQAGKYSGGMKRRLSVAISFMAGPPVVYLDGEEQQQGVQRVVRWWLARHGRRERSGVRVVKAM